MCCCVEVRERNEWEMLVVFDVGKERSGGCGSCRRKGGRRFDRRVLM